MLVHFKEDSNEYKYAVFSQSTTELQCAFIILLKPARYKEMSVSSQLTKEMLLEAESVTAIH